MTCALKDHLPTRAGDSWGNLFQVIDRRQSALVAALSLASAATEGLGLILLVPMLQALGGGHPTQGGFGRITGLLGARPSISTMLALFVVLVFLRGGFTLVRQLSAQKLQASLVDGLRARAWDALLHCNWRVLSRMRQSENASLLISSVDAIGIGVNQLVGSVSSGATLIALASAAVIISPRVTAVALAGGALLMMVYRPLRRRARALGQQTNRAYEEIHAEVGEGLAALRVVKTLGLEDIVGARLSSHFAKLRRAQRHFIRDAGAGQILLQGGGASLLAAVVWLAIHVWGANVAAILPMVALFARALPLLDVFQQALQNTAHALPALDRTMLLLAEAESGREPNASPTTAAPRVAHSIRLEAVTVRHPGRTNPALGPVDVELRLGTITAVVGPSGAGKSTMADVLSGLIAPDAGELVIDGRALDNAERRVWRSQVAYVQQEPVLFTGSVRENLLLSHPGASDVDMMDALRRASAGFVEQLPDGIDSSLGERGLRLSGGERQRIALARGLLRRPQLLILDEPASALDPENEEAISVAIEAMRHELIVFIIGHRGLLPGIADAVIRLENGRVQSPGGRRSAQSPGRAQVNLRSDQRS